MEKAESGTPIIWEGVQVDCDVYCTAMKSWDW